MEQEVVRTSYFSPVSQLINLIVGIITLLLSLRFIFLFLGVNQVAIVNFVYGVTDFMVRPFYGLFGREFISGTQRIEIEALICMAVVWLIGGILSSIFRTFQ